MSSQALWDIGPRNIFNYTWHWHNPLGLRLKFYNFLNEIYQGEKDPFPISDPLGNIVPHLMADWFKGTIDSFKALKIINKALKESKNLDASQKGIFSQLALVIFDPAKHISNKRVIYNSIQFAKKAKKKGYRLFIISNWDAVTFQALKSEFKHLFDLFDDIIISAEVHSAKPDPKIYELAVSQFNIDPKDTVFIDDQADNLPPAKALGMHTIHYTGRKLRYFRNYPITDKALKKLK